ncbi:MAG: hypothetical protein ABI572_04835, partial [Actinomycetota bacterium]
MLLLLVIDTIWWATSATRDLRSARDQLTWGGDLLVAGDVSGAQAAFAQASALARDAIGYFSHPAARSA